MQDFAMGRGSNFHLLVHSSFHFPPLPYHTLLLPFNIIQVGGLGRPVSLTDYQLIIINDLRHISQYKTQK